MAAVMAPVRSFEHDGSLRQLASARRDRVRFVDIPAHRFISIDGHDVPGTQAFGDAIGALFGVAYPLHVGLRARGVSGHRIGMLEALFWLTPEELTAEGPSAADPNRPWSWRLLIAVPDEADDEEVTSAIELHEPGPLAGRVRLLRWAEGPSAQILHVGSYESETPTLRRLFAAIADAGLRPLGAHHEIYLNDPHRVGEERTKTVLRQPVIRP
jgi:hypothetical protein